MLAATYSSQELDRLLAMTLPFHVKLYVRAMPDGTFAPTGLRYEFGMVYPLEDWPLSCGTSDEALQVGLAKAKERMRGRWLWRHAERFSKS